MYPKIILKPNRDKSILRRHPWIFSGAISEVRGSPAIGATVQVLDSENNFLCWAAYSPRSQITARVWSWDESEKIDDTYFHRKIKRAINLRARYAFDSNAFRLVYAESDGLPGLIIDRYVDHLVIQLLSAGAEYWKDTIIEISLDLTGISNIVERSDVEIRTLEGLDERKGLISGETLPENLEIHENKYRYFVDLMRGHKTGFYLDQKDNRAKIAKYVKGKDILDCFCYSGGFTIPALMNGANSITCIDSSKDALLLAQNNLELNNLADQNVEFIEGDVFYELRKLRDRNMSFDLIILDPPKFAPTKSSISSASRGYKDINLLAFKLLKPGGYLITFSCSGAINEALFQKIVADAALDAGVEANLIERLYQSFDHPVGLNFPEGAYLKGFIIYEVD